MLVALVLVGGIALLLLITPWLKPRGKVVAGYFLGAAIGGFFALSAASAIVPAVELQTQLIERVMAFCGLQQQATAWAQFMSGIGEFGEVLGIGIASGCILAWFIRKYAKSPQR